MKEYKIWRIFIENIYFVVKLNDVVSSFYLLLRWKSGRSVSNSNRFKLSNIISLTDNINVYYILRIGLETVLDVKRQLYWFFDRISHKVVFRKLNLKSSHLLTCWIAEGATENWNIDVHKWRFWNTTRNINIFDLFDKEDIFIDNCIPQPNF